MGPARGLRRHPDGVEAGYLIGGLRSPFRPVWNREAFATVKRLVHIPVPAVGGIRSAEEVHTILDRATTRRWCGPAAPSP